MAATLSAWDTPTKLCIIYMRVDGKAWCLDILRKLGIKIVAFKTPVEHRGPRQHLHLTLELPSDLHLPPGIQAGYTDAAVDEESESEVTLEIVAANYVENVHGKLQPLQLLQLQLHGSIPCTLPDKSKKHQRHSAALQELEQQFYNLLACLLLWLFRGPGVLKRDSAWGALRWVRPEIHTPAATPSSSQGSG
jgi:hypothetical protein